MLTLTRTMRMGFLISFSILKPLLLLLTLSNIGFIKGCWERERLALLDFKKSFASFPNNHGKLSSWNSSEDAKDCCSWEGIFCDDPRKHVVHLDLNGQGLESYHLPDIFHGLISLERLDLSSNDLEDGIFNSIGNLCKLNKLSTSGCIINQSLPNILQALSSGCARSSLMEIDLDSMNLTGSIPPMLKFHSLTTLNLNDNDLHTFPNTTLPIFPARLTNLYARNNNLSVLSDLHFTNLAQLQTLDLATNPNLRVSFNKPLSGPYVSVNLSSCNLGPNFPSWLLVKNNIIELDISHSMISSSIPIMFWENISPFLHFLNLSANSLYGTVPNLPFRFSDPELIIDLNSNSLSGLIPSSFFMANELYLSNNNFSGFTHIPHPYNLSTFLSKNYISNDSGSPTILDLSNNILSGVLPHWLSIFMPKLGALILTNNYLSGTLPSSIAQTVPIYVLSLRNNNFSGPLPSLLKKCNQLRILDMGENRFSGFIPSWFGEALKNLTVLSLRSNSFTGKLPTNLCHLNSLQILDVSNNLLSGNIPPCINEFTAMAHNVNSSLEVSYREGEVITVNTLELTSYYNAYIKWKSKVWKFQSTLRLVKLIDLSSNNLSGEIPRGLASLVELDSVDLSGNSLQGRILEQIGQLKSLQLLNLSCNRLCGTIPQSLSEISALEMLDLSHNNLSGRIPKGTQLQSFDSSAFVGNTQLCGLPLRKRPGDKDDSVQPPPPSPTNDSKMKQDNQWFYAGLGVGFACGFFGILGTLNWIRKWRIAFFQFATHLGEWILLVVALSMSKISRKLRFK